MSKKTLMVMKAASIPAALACTVAIAWLPFGPAKVAGMACLLLVMAPTSTLKTWVCCYAMALVGVVAFVILGHPLPTWAGLMAVGAPMAGMLDWGVRPEDA